MTYHETVPFPVSFSVWPLKLLFPEDRAHTLC